MEASTNPTSENNGRLAWKTQPGGDHVGGKKLLTCPSTGCPPSVPSVGRGSCPTKDLFIDATRGNTKAGSLPPPWQIIVNILSNPFSKFTNISPAVQYGNKRSGDPAPRGPVGTFLAGCRAEMGAWQAVCWLPSCPSPLQLGLVTFRTPFGWA